MRVYTRVYYYHTCKLIYTRDNSQHRVLTCGGDSPTVDASRLLKLASGSRVRLLGYTHVPSNSHA